jgi:hypothetical protein
MAVPPWHIATENCAEQSAIAGLAVIKPNQLRTTKAAAGNHITNAANAETMMLGDDHAPATHSGGPQ